MLKNLILIILLSNGVLFASNKDSLKDSFEINDLRNGDILLYSGKSLISGLIKFFDGSVYSHTGIYNKGKVLEATSKGVVNRSLIESIDGNNFIDVYRFNFSETGDSSLIKDFEKNLLNVIEKYEIEGERYAYEQFLLLGILTLSRTANLPLIAPVLRGFLDNSSEYLTSLIAAGKRPVICSELVYRCYSELDSTGLYTIKIKGNDLNENDIYTVNELLFILKSNNTDSEILELINSEYKKFLNKYLESKASRNGYFTIPDFVTPKDLKNSKSLIFIGRLNPN